MNFAPALSNRQRASEAFSGMSESMMRALSILKQSKDDEEQKQRQALQDTLTNQSIQSNAMGLQQKQAEQGLVSQYTDKLTRDATPGALGPSLPGEDNALPTPFTNSTNAAAFKGNIIKQLRVMRGQDPGDPVAEDAARQAETGKILGDAQAAPQLRQLNIAKTQAETTKSLAEANKANAEAGAQKAITDGGQQDASDVAKGLVSGDLKWDEFNNLYTGRGPQAGLQKRQVYAEAKKLDPNFSPAEMEKSYKAYSSPQNQRAIAQIDAVKPNLQKLVELSSEIPRSGLPAVNKMILAGKYQIGDQTVTNFDEMRHALSDELGLAMSGTNGYTDTKLQLAKDMLNASPSDANYASNIKVIDGLLDSRKAAIVKPMGVYAKKIMGDAQAEPSTSTAAPVVKWGIDPKTGVLGPIP